MSTPLSKSTSRDYWNELNQTHKDAHTLPVPGDPFESKAPNTVEFKKKMEAIGREAAPEPAPPPVEKKRELSNKVYVGVPCL
jgi:hypothetical protein